MRRVVVSVNESGMSYVSSDEAAPDEGTIWISEPAAYAKWVSAIDPDGLFQAAQPPAGGARWAIGHLAPHTQSAGVEPGKEPPAGLAEDGFHVTKSVDLVYVLEGKLELDLDEGGVTLAQGECVVLQAARHAWRNPNDEPVRFLDVLISAE